MSFGHRYKMKLIIALSVFASLLFGVNIFDGYCAESFLQAKVEKISGPQLKGEDLVRQVLRNLEIPKDIGFIKEVKVSENPSDKMIINIQDLHCNYQAQKNISAILDHLSSTYGLKLVSVEGGSGKIDTTFYKQLPDPKVKEQVADYFLKEARINGTEYFAITTTRDIALYGAEDEKYYNKNLEAFLHALPNREKTLESIAVLENSLNILKSKIYNKKLNELDDHIVAYENQELGFEDYIIYIRGLYPKEKFKNEFGQVYQLGESVDIKKNLTLEKAEAERAELIDYFTKNLPRNELEDFLKVTVEFKAKTINALVYHNKLKSLYSGMDKKSKTLDRAWPELYKYIEYLNKYETLDKFALFSEIDKLVERIKNDLYTSFTQKKLDHELRLIRLARGLYSTQLLNRDLAAINKYKNDFDIKKMKKFIESEAQRLKITVSLPDDEAIKEMEKNLPYLEDFYYYASERNNILIGNTLKGMEEQKENIGILVTGGFHTDGITDYLKEKRITYVVIAPMVDKLDDTDERYINALKGKKTPFEEMIETEAKTSKEEGE